MLSEFLLSEMSRLSASDALPLHRQLYEALRRAMLGAKLVAGERLPSSRELAADLGLSRNTVVAALNPGAPIGAMSLHGKTLLATIGWGAGVQTWQVTTPLAPQFQAFWSVQGQTYDVLETATGLWLPMGWPGILLITQ